MDGLKLAISLGDLRIIYLLVWAGGLPKYNKTDQVHPYLLNWSIRNAGGGRLEVVEGLINFGSWPENDQDIRATIAELDIEAEDEDNNEKREYIRKIKDLVEFYSNNPGDIRRVL